MESQPEYSLAFGLYESLLATISISFISGTSVKDRTYVRLRFPTFSAHLFRSKNLFEISFQSICDSCRCRCTCFLAIPILWAKAEEEKQEEEDIRVIETRTYSPKFRCKKRSRPLTKVCRELKSLSEFLHCAMS